MTSALELHRLKWQARGMMRDYGLDEERIWEWRDLSWDDTQFLYARLAQSPTLDLAPSSVYRALCLEYGLRCGHPEQFRRPVSAVVYDCQVCGLRIYDRPDPRRPKAPALAPIL